VNFNHYYFGLNFAILESNQATLAFYQMSFIC